jgi:uncharacterized membrane protein YfhO
MMIQKEFRPGQEVLLEEEPKWGGNISLPKTNDEAKPLSRLLQTVDILSENNNRLILQAKAIENSLLVLSDTYFPGWKAFVDGKETKIYRADYAFRAIPLKAGTHRVEFIYDPISFKLGVGGTLMGIIGCVVIILAPRREKPFGHDRKV